MLEVSCIKSEYILYLTYRALALGLSAIGVSYFIVNFLELSLVTSLSLLALSVYFTTKGMGGRPYLAKCLDSSNFFVSFVLSFSMSLSYISIVLLLANIMKGIDISIYAIFGVCFIGVIFATLYFLQCKKEV